MPRTQLKSRAEVRAFVVAQGWRIVNDRKIDSTTRFMRVQQEFHQDMPPWRHKAKRRAAEQALEQALLKPLRVHKTDVCDSEWTNEGGDNDGDVCVLSFYVETSK